MINEKVKDFINTNDRFSRSSNIQLIHAEPGYAEAELIVTENALNSRGMVQGGAIFTLCDLAFAGAANAGNDGMIAMAGNITFVRPGTGKRLRAVAREVNRGSRTGVYDIDVFNEADKLVAHTTINGFATGCALLPEEK